MNKSEIATLNKSRTVSGSNKFFLVISVIYFLLVIFQISGSSLGILKSNSESHSGVLFGTARSIRSDEYLRSSPDFLGRLNFANTPTPFDVTSKPTNHDALGVAKDLLSTSPDQFIVNTVVRYLPRDMGFSFIWWYATFLTALVVPVFLRKLGVRAKYGYAATLILIISPSSQWWSNSPLQYISSACLSGLLLIYAVDSDKSIYHNRNIWAKYILALFGILVFLPLPLIYPPWTIPTCVIVGALIIGHLIYLRRSNRLNFKLTIGIFVGIVIGLVCKLVISVAAISTILATVYPGQRRAPASGTGLPIFATNLISKLASSGESLVAGNQSELSVSMLELLVIFISLVPLLFLTKVRGPLYYPLIAAYIPTAIFVSWIFPVWPHKLLSHNPLTLIPPDRMAQILSMISILLFFTLLSFIQERCEPQSNVLKIAYFGTLTPVIILVAMGDQKFQSFFVQGVITNKEILISLVLLIFSLIGFVATRKYIFEISVGILVSLSFFPLINPVQMGTGGVTHSKLALALNELDHNRLDTWASDSIFLDAILMANTQETLSGQQYTGPNMDSWHVLDSAENYKNAWNRGSSYVTFEWTNGSKVEMSNPNPDIIKISIDPCSKSLSELSVDYILTAKDLSNSCLTKIGTYEWENSPTNIYKIVNK